MKKKVLVIKLCCIGDIIQMTPALRAVKKSGDEVHLLCAPWVNDVAGMVPFIDKKYNLDQKDPFSIVMAIIALRREKYDLIINFHRDFKSYIFAFLAGAKSRAGFNWKGQGLFIDRSFVFDENEHESRRYLSITQGLGYKTAGFNTELKAPAVIREKTATKMIGLFPGGGKNPGTVMTTKRWPVENFIRLAQGLGRCETHIFGGATDSDVVSALKKALPSAVVENTNNLKELAVRISAMDVFVAGDTGPLHMSAALGVKTVGLFGPTSPELVGPPGKHVINLWGKTACAPCYVPGTVHKKEFLKCADNRCMKAVTVEKTIAAVKKLLKIKRNAR